MSYDVYLQDPVTSETVSVGRHEEGGTYALGGICEAHLNITWNYAKHFYRTLPIPEGTRFGEWLTGLTGAEVIPHLEKSVAELGTVRDRDYWADTAGNAGYALSILLGWARLHPTAVFESD